MNCHIPQLENIENGNFSYLPVTNQIHVMARVSVIAPSAPVRSYQLAPVKEQLSLPWYILLLPGQILISPSADSLSSKGAAENEPRVLVFVAFSTAFLTNALTDSRSSTSGCRSQTTRKQASNDTKTKPCSCKKYVFKGRKKHQDERSLKQQSALNAVTS